MATMPLQVDEEALILAEVNQIELPEGVRFKKLQASVDGTGDPIWQIFFAVSKSIPLTRRRIREVRQMKESLRDKLLAQQISGWPLVRLLDAR